MKLRLATLTFAWVASAYTSMAFWSIFSHLEAGYLVRLSLFGIFSTLFFVLLRTEFKSSPTPKANEPNDFIKFFLLSSLCIYSAWQFPYPAIFHIHTFGILDIARSIYNKGLLPWLPISEMAPNSVFVATYPSHLVLGFMISFLGPLLGEPETAFRVMNIFSISLFLGAAASAFYLASGGESTVRRTSLLVLFSLALPPLFEVFIKYPASDLAAFPFIFLFFVGLTRYHQNLSSPFVMCLAFAIASSVRIYLLPVMGLILLIFTAANWRLRIFRDLARMGFLKLLLCCLLMISWPFIFYSHYRTFWNDFATIRPPLSSAEQIIKDFRTATNSTQVLEGSALKEVNRSLFANSIYYKTFERPSLLSDSSQKFNEVLSTPLFLLVLVGLILLWRRNFVFLSFDAQSIYYWAIGVVCTVLLLNKSSFPMVKIVGMSSAALFFFLSNQFASLDKFKLRIVYCALIPFCIWQHLVVPTLESNYSGGDFRRKYGNKIEFIDALNAKGADSSNTLWVVRAEHGGFLPQLMGGHLWDYKWYDSPNSFSVHSAKTENELLDKLKASNLKYVVSANEAETNRFFVEPFQNQLHLPELLLKEIIGPSAILKPVYDEPQFRGLELKLFEIVDEGA